MVGIYIPLKMCLDLYIWWCRWIWIGWWLWGRGWRKRHTISSIFKIMKKLERRGKERKRDKYILLLYYIKKMLYIFTLLSYVISFFNQFATLISLVFNPDNVGVGSDWAFSPFRASRNCSFNCSGTGASVRWIKPTMNVIKPKPSRDHCSRTTLASGMRHITKLPRPTPVWNCICCLVIEERIAAGAGIPNLRKPLCIFFRCLRFLIVYKKNKKSPK